MASSWAAGDTEQAKRDQEHSGIKKQQNVDISDRVCRAICDMLDIVGNQSEISSTNQTVYIFLSRIEGILGHIQIHEKNKKDYLETIGRERGIPEDLINTHILWTHLVTTHGHLPENFDKTLMQIRVHQKDLSIGEILKSIWNRTDKKKFSRIITNVTQYQMLVRYFCLRKYGKTLEEWKNGKKLEIS